MWKFVARGIRETLERRACRTNVYSQTSQDGNTKSEVKTSLTCNHKFLAPSFSAYNNGFCGSAKAGGTKDNDQDSKWNAKHTWSDAVSWSSILAVGWVVCQTLCLHRRVFEKEKTDSLKGKLLPASEARNCLFGHVLNLQPKHLLPVANCIGNSSKKPSQDGIESSWAADKPFGPITIEEALKEASDEFVNTHKLVMGEFELRYGIKALEEKRYNDAVKHFTAGALVSSPGSLFNLALCYELGLGTHVDQKKAAKYYSDAADQGHADAMYNLGVFHAQGRGGFSVDVNRARNYFVKAAELGQAEAQHALELEKSYNQENQNTKTLNLVNNHESSISYKQNTNSRDNILKKIANYNKTLNAEFHVEPIPSMPGHNNELKATKNPTEIFLEYLGLKEPSIVPIAVVSNDCSVRS